MNDVPLFLMLTTAIAIGWLLGRFQRLPSTSASKNIAPYGAGFLVSDVPDHALDSFLAALDVNSDTLETHLALGAIYRRKGEIGRAIRIHENLLAREELTKVQHDLSGFELATDYQKAGLLDRAEKYLQNLVESSPICRKPSLMSLLDIYQQSKEWRKAVNVANLLTEDSSERRLKKEMNRLRSHFYCELARLAITEHDYLGARRSLSRSEQYSANHLRSELLRVELELILDRPKKAISGLRTLVDKATVFPDAMITLLEQMSKSLAGEKEYRQLLDFIYEKFPAPDVVRLLFSELSKSEGTSQGVRFLLDELSQQPSCVGLKEALVSGAYSDESHPLVPIVSALISREEQAGRLYRCGSCGFSGHQWHWQCPTCHRWDSMTYVSESGFFGVDKAG
jgi:lipopolysaccharide biosynthesis regulator YciM|tara:strand:+ start:59969 stop:61156 length:1188 start_codon:yes stop_codon:yes gene_type:complete